MYKRFRVLLMISFGLFLAAQAWSQSSATEAQSDIQNPKGVDLLWGVKIPMRDGVKLNATVYKPTGQRDPLPVVFTLTPYNADTYHDRAIYFAHNGYVFVLVDCRGRGNSGGQFEPFVNEGRDGHDIVEWLAGQPWSNGKVAIWGGSYAGSDQWSTLKELPPHLATIVPASAPYFGIDWPFWHNIFYTYDIQWITGTSGLTAYPNFFGDSSYWFDKYREFSLKHLPSRSSTAWWAIPLRFSRNGSTTQRPTLIGTGLCPTPNSTRKSESQFSPSQRTTTFPNQVPWPITVAICFGPASVVAGELLRESRFYR
jgi:hypothetical protein